MAGVLFLIGFFVAIIVAGKLLQRSWAKFDAYNRKTRVKHAVIKGMRDGRLTQDALREMYDRGEL